MSDALELIIIICIIIAVLFFSASSVTGCFTNNGEDFHANVSVTEKGYVCQAWNSTKPHYHILSPEDHPEIGGGHNFCRNPGGQKRQPWCFTTDESAKFDYCDIPRCGERISLARGWNERGIEAEVVSLHRMLVPVEPRGLVICSYNHCKISSFQRFVSPKNELYCFQIFGDSLSFIPVVICNTKCV